MSLGGRMDEESPGGTHGSRKGREGQGSGSGGKTAGASGHFRTWEGGRGIGHGSAEVRREGSVRRRVWGSSGGSGTCGRLL